MADEDKYSREFETKTIEGIATLIGKTDGLHERILDVKDRVDKINGSISTLYKRAEENKTALMEHQIRCPVRDTVAEIERQLSTGDHPGAIEVKKELEAYRATLLKKEGKAEGIKTTWQHIEPFAKWVVMGVIILILLHANDLLKAIFK